MEEHDGFTEGKMRRNSGESLTFQINVCFYPKPLEKLNDDTTDTLIPDVGCIYDFCLFYVFKAYWISVKVAIRKDQRGYF